MKTVHAILLSAFLAALGFSYALATSAAGRGPQAPRARAAAGNRNVTQPLRFTNPFLVAGTDSSFALAGDPLFPQGGDAQDDPDGFDLGDATLGTSVLRYINAAGGFLPYEFSLRPVLGSQNIGGSPVPPSLPAIDATGKLTGDISPLAGSVLRFSIDLTDFIATQRIGIFKLNLFPAVSAFRIAQSQLPFGVLGQAYYTNISTIGGGPDVQFEVVPFSILVNNQPVAELRDIGLNLAPDGTLIGRPLAAGAIGFTVHARDAANNLALSRNGTQTGQRFIFNVESNAVATTEVLATSCAIRGTLEGTDSDSFKYAGILDAKGEIGPTLAGTPFVLRVGGASFSGTLDEKGRVKEKIGAKGKFTVSYSAAMGRLKIGITKTNLAAAVGAGAITTNGNVAIGMELGAVRTCDLLGMAAGVRGARYQMGYTLGGRKGSSPCGGFQIVSVHGSDGKVDGETGDRWLVRFLGVPRMLDGKAPGDAVSSTSSVTIRIGDSFSQTVSVGLKSVRLEFKATSLDPGIFRLLLDPKKFLHRLETNVLASDATSVPPAFESKDPALFRLGMDFSGYSGENGRVIVPNRTTWTQR